MNNKIAMSTLRGVSVNKSVDFAVECGFSGIEIQTDYLLEDVAEQNKSLEYAVKNGLTVSLHAPCGDINISALNRGIRRESVSQVKQAIDLAEVNGGRVVTFHPGRLSSARENIEDKWKVLLDAVCEIAEYAKEKKVYVAIENMEFRKKEVVYTVDDLNRFENIGKNNPYFGVTLDFSHFATNKIYAPEISELKLPVYNVHLSQCVNRKPHCPLYEDGEIEINDIQKILDSCGYESVIVLELKSIFEKDIYIKSREFLLNS